jgi:hypothetical protein
LQEAAIKLEAEALARHAVELAAFDGDRKRTAAEAVAVAGSLYTVTLEEQPEGEAPAGKVRPAGISGASRGPRPVPAGRRRAAAPLSPGYPRAIPGPPPGLRLPAAGPRRSLSPVWPRLTRC